MFSSFLDPSVANSPRSRSGDTIPNSASPDKPQPSRPRQKRSQVARACDWCRVHRVKCDNHYPCLNCQSRGGQCSNDKSNEFRTLPHAFREIERLRQRNKELQRELEEERNRNQNQITSQAGAYNPQVLTPVSLSWISPAAVTTPSGPPSIHGGSSMYWEGVYTNIAKSPAKNWYGPASLFYFINRVNCCLDAKFQHLPEQCMHLNSASKLLDGPMSPPEKPITTNQRCWVPPDDATKGYLTPTQEEYFLNIYWQAFHASLFVLYEDDFKAHYKSLWAGSRKTRKPSALVDIVLALCMQYGIAQDRGKKNPSLRGANIDLDDASLAGRWHYYRCQTLLASELESPTISTLQCNILASYWLCCASFHNIADIILAQAARTAQMLGLHLAPPKDMPPRERELRKRLWWSIYVLDCKTSMKLGRPFLLHLSPLSSPLPSDSHEVAAQSGSDYAPLDDHTTWLTWDLHNTKLFLTTRNIHTAFYDKYPELFDGEILSAAKVEAHADALITQMKALETWASNVPEVLKMQRENSGTPFSTDGSPLAIEPFAPLWVQQQRLMLELPYHNLCVNLYRPFLWLRCMASSQAATPLADSCTEACLRHAMAFTHMARQVLTSTDFLGGWNEAFQWQWNCAMTLVGFVLSCPRAELVREAREAIGAAVHALSLFGNSFAIAASAADVVRGLSVTIDTVVTQLDESKHQSLTRGGSSDVALLQTVQQQQEATPMTASVYAEFDDESIAAMQDILEGSMDMALAIDGYNGANILWPNLGMPG
ncbi:hypothetical protein M426DRAFT_19462 [Hypoxylon sp. CI-4A]|nr:hypothetical protein M426DRAFT_19462 [Hypoxylon sp. CI-4A]